MEPPLKKAKVSEEIRLGNKRWLQKKKRVFLSDLDFFSQKNIGKFAEKQQSPRCLRRLARRKMRGTTLQLESRHVLHPSWHVTSCHFLSLFSIFSIFSTSCALCLFYACSLFQKYHSEYNHVILFSFYIRCISIFFVRRSADSVIRATIPIPMIPRQEMPAFLTEESGKHVSKSSKSSKQMQIIKIWNA